MFNQGSTYSLSDIAAVSGRGNGGWGDENGAWWIIILLLAFAGCCRPVADRWQGSAR